MAIDVKPDHDESVTSLVSGIISDAQELLKQQFELLKHEVREDLRKTKDVALLFAVATAIGMVGAILLAFMSAHLLAWAVPDLPLWGCYGISGATLLAIGGAIFAAGRAKLDSLNPLPDETAQALKENMQWISNPK